MMLRMKLIAGVATWPPPAKYCAIFLGVAHGIFLESEKAPYFNGQHRKTVKIPAFVMPWSGE
jgi:hypothetical protein